MMNDMYVRAIDRLCRMQRRASPRHSRYCTFLYYPTLKYFGIYRRRPRHWLGRQKEACFKSEEMAGRPEMAGDRESDMRIPDIDAREVGHSYSDSEVGVGYFVQISVSSNFRIAPPNTAPVPFHRYGLRMSESTETQI